MQQRITINEIKNHKWFLKNLPADLMDGRTMGDQFQEGDQQTQSIDVIMHLIAEATIPAVGTRNLDQYLIDNPDLDDDMVDLESDLGSDSELDIDSSGEIIYAL